MTINFECKKCRREFDCEVGELSLPEDGMHPIFEKDIICLKYGELLMDDMFITEVG